MILFMFEMSPIAEDLVNKNSKARAMEESRPGTARNNFKRQLLSGNL